MENWTRIEYKGWDNCYCFENSKLKVIVTTDVGPRVIFLGLSGGENQFYENAEEAGLSGGDAWMMYGGHRFWAAPESKERTYIADNFPVEPKVAGNSIYLTAPVEPCGIRKTLHLEPISTINSVKVTHLLTNKGVEPIEVAPWGLSVMRAGGTAIIPLPPKALHTALLTPTLSFTHWGYTDITDTRWSWGEKFLILRQDEYHDNPQKIGVHTSQDWAAYLNNGNLFVKFSKFIPNVTYPDFGSHFEFFTNKSMLEMESLGALTLLQPEQQISHVEYWSLFEGIKTVLSDEGVEENILPLVEKSLKSIQ